MVYNNTQTMKKTIINW